MLTYFIQRRINILFDTLYYKIAYILSLNLPYFYPGRLSLTQRVPQPICGFGYSENAGRDRAPF